MAQAAEPIQRVHTDRAHVISTIGFGPCTRDSCWYEHICNRAAGLTLGVTALLFPSPKRATGTETKSKGTLSPVPPVITSKEQTAVKAMKMYLATKANTPGPHF